MRGSVLRELRESRGLKAAWVAERAGYDQPHYSKIEAKESIRVEEFERITRAMDIRPGDLLDNSIEDVKPLLPLVGELKRFDPSDHPYLREILRNAALMLEQRFVNLGLRDGDHSTISDVQPYTPQPKNYGKDDAPEHSAAVLAGSASQASHSNVSASSTGSAVASARSKARKR